MITIITGSPGAGKSLMCLQDYILPALRNGRYVFHNIPGLDFIKISFFLGIEPEAVEKNLNYAHEKSADDILKEIEKMPKNALAVIDEAQQVINSRDWDKEKNRIFLKYATKHRHYGHDVVFASQHEDSIDVGIRRISNLCIRIRRLEFLGLKNKVQVRFYAGGTTENSAPLYKSYKSYDKRIFGLYNSYDVDQAVEIRKSGTVWRNGFFIFLMVLLALCLTRVPHFMEKMGFFKEKKVAKAAEPVDMVGGYMDYYCGDKFYVLRVTGKIDTLEPKTVPSSYCPKFGYSFSGGQK